MTQNYVTVSIKSCADVWNDEHIILCKFIQFNLINSIYFSQYALTNPKSQTKVFYLATTALVPFTKIQAGSQKEQK